MCHPTPSGAGNPLNPTLDGDQGLQSSPDRGELNEEFPVSTGHKHALIKTPAFVHVACHYYRLDGLARPSDLPARQAHGLAERSTEKTVTLEK